jgi:hypothetical protein
MPACHTWRIWRQLELAHLLKIFNGVERKYRLKPKRNALGSFLRAWKKILSIEERRIKAWQIFLYCDHA